MLGRGGAVPLTETHTKERYGLPIAQKFMGNNVEGRCKWTACEDFKKEYSIKENIPVDLWL